MFTAALGAMVLAGCGGSVPSGDHGADRRTNYRTDEEANRRAMEALELVGRSLEDSGDPTFGGAWIDSSGVIFAVVSHPSRNVEAAISTVKQEVPVEVRMVSYSLAQLLRRTQEISADEPAWSKKGLSITAVGPDIPRNRVVVTFSTAEIPTGLRNTFLQTYGPEVTIGPPGTAVGS